MNYDDLEPLFSCQNRDCACECSYPAGDLRLWNDKPICEHCFDGEAWAGYGPHNANDGPLSYGELPPFIPSYRREIERLQAELAEAVLAEREACAKVAEAERVDYAATEDPTDLSYNIACEHIAAAIRERTDGR